MSRRTMLILIVALTGFALLITSGWSARNFTKWCGDFMAWGRQVNALTVFMRILLGAGVACLAASIVSQRLFKERAAPVALAAIPLVAAFAFAAMVWFFKFAAESGLFTGISVKCLLDSRGPFQLIADGFSNLWRNSRALLIGDLLVAVALLVQIGWVWRRRAR